MTETNVVVVATATDNCNQEVTCSATFTVGAVEEPDIDCPGPMSIEWPADFPVDVPNPAPGVILHPSIDPGVVGNPTPTLDCPQQSLTFQDVLFGPNPQDCPELWYIVRTWTVTDICNNSADCTQRITFTDYTPPTISCPDDFGVECDGDVPPPYADFDAFTAAGGSADDNCAVNPNSFMLLRFTDTGAGICPRTIKRVYKIADACNNTATCTQTIEVNDETNPTVTCDSGPHDLGCNTPATEADALSKLISASDNCGTVDNGDVNALPGLVTGDDCNKRQIWTLLAEDNCGNEGLCLVTFTWTEDTEPPTLSCPDDIDFTEMYTSYGRRSRSDAIGCNRSRQIVDDGLVAEWVMR